MKKMIALLIALIMMCGFALAESSDTSEAPDTALEILAAMIEKGAPINPENIIDYTEDTDPNKKMGEADGYTSKTDYICEGYAEGSAWESAGGTLEVFDDASYAKARFDDLVDIYTRYPTWLNCRTYIRGVAVLRISTALTSNEASAILTTFENVVSGETEAFDGATEYADEQPKQQEEWLDVAKKVALIGQRSVSYVSEDDAQRILFALMNEDEEQLASPAIVDVEIVNDNGEVVYTKTHYVSPGDYGTWTNSFSNAKNLLCSIEIPTSNITPGSSKTGTMNITVHYKTEYEYNGLYDVFAFPEYSDEVSALPYDSPANKSTLEITAIPETVSHYWNNQTLYTVTLEDVSYEFSDSSQTGMVDLTIYFTGKKTYDMEGENHSDECRIGIKLYQGDYVIKSGEVYTTSVAVGEGFKNSSVTYRGIEAGEYRLKILDVE